VAHICRCEVGTVKSRVNRARNLLKKTLLEDELPIRKEELPICGIELPSLAAADAMPRSGVRGRVGEVATPARLM
jgi:hypothetical protein